MKTILIKSGKKRIFKYVDKNGNELSSGRPSSRIDIEMDLPVGMDINLITVKNFEIILDEEKLAAKNAKENERAEERAQRLALKNKLKNKNATTDEIQEALGMLL